MPSFPSIDLHTHIRGALEYDDIIKFSVDNNISISAQQLQLYKNRSWASFSEFLETYHELGSVVHRVQDWTHLVETYLTKVSKSGTLYVELMVSPMHIMNDDISYTELISALQLGVDRAFDRCGIKSAIVITCVRHNGPKEAIILAEMVSVYPSDIVVGFGLTGDERSFHASEFSTAFKIAKNAGLMLTAHTGEWLPARSVLETVNALELNRVGHGIAVVNDKEVMTELIQRNVGFEVCISSNVALKAVENLNSHPFLTLYNAGAMVSLGVDDPTYFGTIPKHEYEIAQTLMGGDFQSLVRQLNTNAVAISFASAEVKNDLRKLVEKENPDFS